MANETITKETVKTTKMVITCTNPNGKQITKSIYLPAKSTVEIVFVSSTETVKENIYKLLSQLSEEQLNELYELYLD